MWPDGWAFQVGWTVNTLDMFQVGPGPEKDEHELGDIYAKDEMTLSVFASPQGHFELSCILKHIFYPVQNTQYIAILLLFLHYTSHPNSWLRPFARSECVFLISEMWH